MSRFRHGPWPTEKVVLENGSILHWDRTSLRRGRFIYLPVTCGRCKQERLVEGAKTRGKSGERFTGLCNSCRLHTLNSVMGKNVDHPAWKGGIFNQSGYRVFQVSILSGRSREIAEQMSRKFGNGTQIVHEHRLVMALSLDRPLLRSEVVHHKNGNKLDNWIENLELTTHANHRKLDVKYYDLWQEALREIAELKSRLEKYE